MPSNDNVDVWYLILESIPREDISIPYFLRLAAVCRASRHVFMSDRAWRALNPYGLERGIAADFLKRIDKLTPDQKDEMFLVWDDWQPRWDLADFHKEYRELGRPYGVPHNLYHRLAVIAYVENNYEFGGETDYSLMDCAVQLNPNCIHKVIPGIPGYDQLVYKAIRGMPSLMRDMPGDIRQNADFMYAALSSEESPENSVLSFAGDLLLDPEFANRVSRLDKAYMKYFPSSTTIV